MLYGRWCLSAGCVRDTIPTTSVMVTTARCQGRDGKNGILPKCIFFNPREWSFPVIFGSWTGMTGLCFYWGFVRETKGQEGCVCRTLRGCPSSMLWGSLLPGPASVCVSLDSVVRNSYRVILGPFYPFPEPWGIYFITARLAKSMDTKASTAIYKLQTKYHSKKPPPQRGESPVS